MGDFSEAEQRLLASIRRATDDDAPRLVYADWLLERGEPLGEYITLACAGKTADSLLGRHEHRWLGDVAEVTVAPRRWTRGLPHRVSLTIGADLRPAIGEPAWRRVQRLDALGDVDVEAAASLIAHEVLRDLHELVVTDELMAALRDAVPDAERLMIFAGPRRSTSELGLRKLLAARPRLRRVYVNVPTRAHDLASLQCPGLKLGVAHALADARRVRRGVRRDRARGSSRFLARIQRHTARDGAASRRRRSVDGPRHPMGSRRRPGDRGAAHRSRACADRDIHASHDHRPGRLSVARTASPPCGPRARLMSTTRRQGVEC